MNESKDYVIQKHFVRLTEDHMFEGSMLYPEGKFIPAGTEGVVIDCHTIGLIPNLSEQVYSIIVKQELMAKKWASYLVLIDDRLVTISASKLETVRFDPPGPIFEDEQDRDQYFDELFNKMKLDYSEGNDGRAEKS